MKYSRGESESGPGDVSPANVMSLTRSREAPSRSTQGSTLPSHGGMSGPDPLRALRPTARPTDIL